MKTFLKGLVFIFQKLIGIINILLIILIVLNIFNLLVLSIGKESYITFLDYTYINIEEDEEYLDYQEGDFLLIDLKVSAIENEVIFYNDNGTTNIGRVLSIGEEDITVKNEDKETTISPDQDLGTVIKVIPHLGSIVEMLLQTPVLIGSVIIIIITSIIQSLLRKASVKLNKPKPDFNKMKDI